MTIKQFTTAARRGTVAVANPIDITFEFEIREGEFVEMTAHPPTTGQLALFFSHQTDGGTGFIRAMFDLLSCILPDDDYKIIEDQLYEGLDVEVLIDMIRYLTEEWSARPTPSSNGSSPSRPSTGRQSTGKRPRAVRTTSP